MIVSTSHRVCTIKNIDFTDFSMFSYLVLPFEMVFIIRESMRTPKENKQKLRDHTPKSTAGMIPKAALKTAWIKTKEQSRTAARENDTDPRQPGPTDLAGSAAEQAAAFVWHQGRKLAETQARQHRDKETAARAHAADERGVSPKQVECGTLPDAAQRPRRGADLPRQRAKEKAITTKTAPRDIRGVTQRKSFGIL